MNILFRSVPITLFLWVAAHAAAGVSAAEPSPPKPAPKLAPGSTFTITFPDMPPIFAELDVHKKFKAKMTVFLPRNYDPARKHPLFIFLSGGNGATGDNPAVARKITEEKDFICLSVPLFKARLDPPVPGKAANLNGRLIMRDADGIYMWPFFKTMLDRLEELVPNIDPARRILGGFSNGAHATAGMVNTTDGEAARRFSAFFLVDGGGGLRRFDLLKGKPLIMVCGAWRPKPEPAREAGVKLTIYHMKKAEHAFPETEYPVVRAWLREMMKEEHP